MPYFTQPSGLKLRPCTNTNDLFAEAGLVSFSGRSDAKPLFGTLFNHGNRLHFVSSTSIDIYLAMARDPRGTVSTKNATVDEAALKANRPTNDAHRKRIADYIRTVLGEGSDGTLGSFTLNYGLDMGIRDGSFDTSVTISYIGPALDPDQDNAVAFSYPAVAIVNIPDKPAFGEDRRMHITDGAHRTLALMSVLADKNTSDRTRNLIRANSVVVNIVFEDRVESAHQDFADAALACPISASVRAVFDVRKTKNEFAVMLVRASTFLRGRVSGVGASVNVTAKSRNGMIYNASAVAAMVDTLFYEHPQLNAAAGVGRRDPKTGTPVPNDKAKMRAMADHIGELWDHIATVFPELNLSGNDLVANRSASEAPLGGSFIYRAAFMRLVALAYKEAVERRIDPKNVITRLAAFQWTYFTSHEDKLAFEKLQQRQMGNTDEAASLLNPLLVPVIALMPDRFKFLTVNDDLERLWDNLCQRIWGEHSLWVRVDNRDTAFARKKTSPVDVGQVTTGMVA